MKGLLWTSDSDLKKRKLASKIDVSIIYFILFYFIFIQRYLFFFFFKICFKFGLMIQSMKNNQT